VNFNSFIQNVENANAIRRRLTLQPAGGNGSYIAPPTYKGDNDKTTHVFEIRRINEADVQCVLLDSVQSQANRLEEALSKSIEFEKAAIPYTYVDFKNTDIRHVGNLSSLDVPHRIFDAIIRDSELDGVEFLDSPMGKEISKATPHNAQALFRYAPTTLIFGGWNSTGELGGSGPRFQRCITSEIIGVNTPIGESKKPASRLDPLGIEKVDIFRTEGGKKYEWSTDKQGKATKAKPSDVNHGNIPPSVLNQGATVDYALQTTVITLAGLRRLSFPDGDGNIDEKRNMAACTVLAALALYAITKQDKAGYSLRSRCDLVPEPAGLHTFEIIQNNGKVEEADITSDGAKLLLDESVENAKKHNLAWEERPVRLEPQAKLVELVKKSMEKSLKD